MLFPHWDANWKRFEKEYLPLSHKFWSNPASKPDEKIYMSFWGAKSPAVDQIALGLGYRTVEEYKERPYEEFSQEVIRRIRIGLGATNTIESFLSKSHKGKTAASRLYSEPHNMVSCIFRELGRQKLPFRLQERSLKFMLKALPRWLTAPDFEISGNIKGRLICMRHPEAPFGISINNGERDMGAVGGLFCYLGKTPAFTITNIQGESIIALKRARRRQHGKLLAQYEAMDKVLGMHWQNRLVNEMQNLLGKRLGITVIGRLPVNHVSGAEYNRQKLMYEKAYLATGFRLKGKVFVCKPQSPRRVLRK